MGTKQKAIIIVVAILLFRIFNVYTSLQTSILSYRTIEIQPIIENELSTDLGKTVANKEVVTNETNKMNVTSELIVENDVENSMAALESIYDPVSKCTISIEQFNLYTPEELMHFKGIGEKTAIAIIEFREKNGLFEDFNDLLLVKGIGEKKLAQMLNSN